MKQVSYVISWLWTVPSFRFMLIINILGVNKISHPTNWFYFDICEWGYELRIDLSKRVMGYVCGCHHISRPADLLNLPSASNYPLLSCWQQLNATHGRRGMIPNCFFVIMRIREWLIWGFCFWWGQIMC